MKYFIFQTHYDYVDFMCKDLSNDSNVRLLKPYHNDKFGIIRFLYRANRKIFKDKNPLEQILYPSFIENCKIKQSDKVCFCVFDSSFLALNHQFLYWIKRKYPMARVVLISYNAIEGREDRACFFSNNYDDIYTFDPYDAAKYKWKHFYGLMPEKESNHEDNNRTLDVVFVGNDKGRYDTIKKIYMFFLERGLRCKFQVYSDREIHDDTDKQIIRRSPMAFVDVLDLERRARYVLDLSSLGTNAQGLSYRVIEAVYTNAGLITNNPFVRQNQCFDKEFVLYFQTIDQINTEIICQNKDIHYSVGDMFSIKKLLQQIASNM